MPTDPAVLPRPAESLRQPRPKPPGPLTAGERYSSGWYFCFFFVSGFCSILYELVWLRLAMAQFGITTALVSIVLSVFMAGLGAGSWGAGVLIQNYASRVSFPPLRLYALSELAIGISALLVPQELQWGHSLLERLIHVGGASSAAYYAASGLWLALALLPWCAFMGATIPLGMLAIRSEAPAESSSSFSFLYLANVLGAVAGTIGPLFLIELCGFHRTLGIAALLNLLICLAALGRTTGSARRAGVKSARPAEVSRPGAPQPRRILTLLFFTGFVSMGAELVWIRLFTPYVGPIVYAFALILASYLLATFAGSRIYRACLRRRPREWQTMWVSIALLGMFPLLIADPRLHMADTLRVLLGVAPFSGALGFLTPMLVDRWSEGDPPRAGTAYAVNVLGCILGPLVSGFLLLPRLGERDSLLLLSLPWLAMALPRLSSRASRRSVWVSGAVLGIAALSIFAFTEDFSAQFGRAIVLRDSTATVTATGSGMNKQLLVNGTGMTRLTPITKMMAHLTLASLDRPPRNALVICFGMGTTFRSAMSWGVPVTVVELVPSVPKLFTYFHADGLSLLQSPLAHVVIDDGRRFLDRSDTAYDAIILDPPPPVETAGSSLLYSQDFYAIARQHLRPDGILQQWLPSGDAAVQSAVARALTNSFPYVEVRPSVEGWGWHFLASFRPLSARTPAQLAAKMPSSAISDMMEWGPAKNPSAQFALVLRPTVTAGQMIARSPGTPALQDDRPVNEYYLLRTPIKNW